MFVLITSRSRSVPDAAFDLFFFFFLFLDPFEPLIRLKINAGQIRVDCDALPQLLAEENRLAGEQPERNYLQISAQLVPLLAARHFKKQKKKGVTTTLSVEAKLSSAVTGRSSCLLR